MRSLIKVLRIGPRIRARITAVSIGKGAAANGKIGSTYRQPFLGADFL